jgi:hypothetical protein
LVAGGPVPLAPPVPFPVPAIPLTSNQLRALRFSERALEEQRRRGVPAPSVIISSAAGQWVVRPGGLPPVPPAPPTAPPRPAAKALVADRPELVHAPWLTPAPRQLADLVRGRP